MDFRVLGPLEIYDGGQPIGVTAPKQRALLGLLLLSPGRTVSTDRILDDLWHGNPPAGGLKTLHYYVSKLRDALQPDRQAGEEGVLVRRPGGYALDLRPEQVDAWQFETLVRDGRRMLESDPAHAAAVLSDALVLWRGRAFEDFVDEPFVQSEIQRLEEMRLTATEDRVEADLAVGRHGELIGELEKLTNEHPLRERLWGQLMVALYRSDRQAEALRVYRRLQRQLVDELGIDPSPDLQELEGRILMQAEELRVAADAKPHRLRGFELRSRLGEGAFGVVWHADQPSIGREVAIKAIRPEYSNRPEFVRGFEAEARLVASLEHPHIVPVFDFWRDPEGAFLVMRLMAGSLADRVRDSTWTIDGALQAVEQVGTALAYAHRRGLIHGDLHPGNVLIDSDGNSYLSDFGLAARPALAVTTPPESYASPEQRSGGSAGSRSDVYGLARLTYYILTGNNPAEGPLPGVSLADRDLSLAIDRVLRRATSEDVSQRPRDAEAFMVDLRAAVGGTQPDESEPRNPYKGLRSFEEADAPDFFGREALVDELADALGSHHLVSVVGPSGSGKSSLVAAGLIPALRAGRLPGSEDWLISVLRPGSDPFAALSEALLSVAVDPTSGLRDGLSDPVAVPRLVEEALPPGVDLVLVVDQFEELFTNLEAESERREFMDILCQLLTGPVRIVLAIRADFYGLPLQYEPLGSLLRNAVVSVTPPGIADLGRIIRRPAEQVGVQVDPEVVTAIVEDVAAQPGSLPLVEYALTRSFDAREGGSLSLESYRCTGGVGGALGGWPEHVVSSYSVEEREATRRVFLHLVSVDDAGTATRRRVPLPELQEIGVAAGIVDMIVGDFGAAHLLTFDRDPESRTPTVEIAHEELLRRWSRLNGWIDQRREALVLQRRFRAAHAEWDQSDHDDGYLLSGGRLRQYESWAADADLALTASEREFLRHAREREDREQSRRRVRRRAVAGVLGAMAVAAVVFAAVAQTQRSRAEEQQQVAEQQADLALSEAGRAEQAALAAEEERVRAEGHQALAVEASAEAESQARLAQARRLASSAILTLESNPELSILLAMEAVQTTRTDDGSILPEAVEALHEAVSADRLISGVPVEMYGRSVTYSPDGDVLYVAGFLSSDVVSAPDGEVIAGLEFAIADAVLAGPNAEWLAVADFDGWITIRDRESFEEVFVLEGHTGWIRDVDASDDGLTLASAESGDQVRVWDLNSRSQISAFECDPADCPGQIWLSGDGTQVGFGSAVYDVASGAVVGSWPGYGNVFEVLEAIGAVVMVDENTVNVVDRESGDLVASISEHTAPVTSIDASSDGRFLATSGREGIAYVWELSGGAVEKLATLGGHQGPVWVVRLSPDGRHAATTGGFQEFPTEVVNTWPEHWEARQWDIGVAGPGEWMAVSGVASGAFSPDGSEVAVATGEGRLAFWDPTTGGETRSLPAGLSGVTSVSYLSGGTELVVGGWGDDAEGRLAVLDAATGDLVQDVVLPDVSFVPRELELSDDGSRLAAVGDTGVHVWDTDGWSLVFTDDDPETDRVFAAATFNPDSSLLVTQSFPQGEDSASRMVVVWDLATGEPIIEAGHFPARNKGAAAFSPDGRLLVTGGVGRPRIFEPYTGRQLGTLDAPAANAFSVAFSPDGSQIATGEADGSVRLWDGATGEEQLVLRAHSAEVSSVAFSPDGSRLLSVDVEGALLVWALEIDDLMEIAGSRVARELTDVECRIWVGVGCPPPPDVQRLAPALADSEVEIGIEADDWAAAAAGGSWGVLEEGIEDLDTLVYDAGSGVVVALDSACSWVVGVSGEGECFPMPPLPEGDEEFIPEPTLSGAVYHPGLDRIIVPRADDGAVFTYDADLKVWEELSPPGGRFADRYGVGMVYEAQSELVVAFGGAEWGRIEDGKHFGLPDTWTYDAALNEWLDAAPDVAPPGRVSHGMVYDSESDRVIVFGGADVFGGAVMGDTWAYDVNTNTWEEMTPAVSPPARAGHAMWYDQAADLVFVFGGSRDWTSWPYLPWDVFGGEELWAYDFNSNAWTLMRTLSNPGYVADLVAVFDEAAGEALVVGGASYDESRRFRWELEDVWSYRHSG